MLLKWPFTPTNNIWDTYDLIVVITIIHVYGLSCFWIYGELSNAGFYIKSLYILQIYRMHHQWGSFETGIFILLAHVDLLTEFYRKVNISN